MSLNVKHKAAVIFACWVCSQFNPFAAAQGFVLAQEDALILLVPNSKRPSNVLGQSGGPRAAEVDYAIIRYALDGRVNCTVFSDLPAFSSTTRFYQDNSNLVVLDRSSGSATVAHFFTITNGYRHSDPTIVSEMKSLPAIFSGFSYGDLPPARLVVRHTDTTLAVRLEFDEFICKTERITFSRNGFRDEDTTCVVNATLLFEAVNPVREIQQIE